MNCSAKLYSFLHLEESSSVQILFSRNVVVHSVMTAEQQCSVTRKLWYYVGAAVQYYVNPQEARPG